METQALSPFVAWASGRLEPTQRLCGPPSADYDAKLAGTRALLAQAARLQPCALASSLGAEDMLLLDLLARDGLEVEVFVLDTGRLHDETLALAERAQAHYGRTLLRYAPDADALARYVAAHGLDAIYTSVELRMACCRIRKTEPLARALAGKRAWITGLRRAQAGTRAGVGAVEWDASHGLAKFNPLADWTEGDVWHYIDQHGVPYNPLHDRFYPSIGCAPCTRAITPGEDVRAGRWWWERPEGRECGLHLHARAPAASAAQPSNLEPT
jgi:phosphoadenosine phosphosulfate reductase